MSELADELRSAARAIGSTAPYCATGRVRRAVGLALESHGPPAAIGEECLLLDRDGKVICRTQVVGFSDGRVFSMPLDRVDGLAAGASIVALGRRGVVGVGEHLLGRVLDADGRPLDGLRLGANSTHYSLDARAPKAMRRERIAEPFGTGIRSIDAAVTLGRGQRIGIFAGSGVGKSTLLGMIARHAAADVAVIALVGERGREVRDFIENDLGDGLQKSVVFVATSDEPPMRRVRAMQAATATAEYFRDTGRHVVLLADSITRVAMAQREIGLSLGEPPSTKGYPPSSFSLLPRLLERAGTVDGAGSITALYTVYVEADDLNDPVGDVMRSLLDGHLVLSRELAERGQYPALDILASVSRVMPQVADEQHIKHARRLRRLLAASRDAEDLIQIGAYQAGSNPDVDAALRARDAVRELLVQAVEEATDLSETRRRLEAVVALADGGAES